HGKKSVAGVEPDQLLHQDHVAGGRNGQPFGDALDDAHQQGFDDFYEHGFPSPRRLGRARMTLVLSVYHIMSPCARVRRKFSRLHRLCPALTGFPEPVIIRADGLSVRAAKRSVLFFQKFILCISCFAGREAAPWNSPLTLPLRPSPPPRAGGRSSASGRRCPASWPRPFCSGRGSGWAAASAPCGPCWYSRSGCGPAASWPPWAAAP